MRTIEPRWTRHFPESALRKLDVALGYLNLTAWREDIADELWIRGELAERTREYERWLRDEFLEKGGKS